MKTKLCVIGEYNGEGGCENAVASVCMLPADSVAFEGTHITMELCAALAITEGWEFIIGYNGAAETLFWGRRLDRNYQPVVDGLDWSAEIKSLKKAIEKNLKKLRKGA